MTNARINEVLKELKEYADIQNQLKVEIEKLQTECKDYMTENNIDEVISDEGIKATYREVISSRFDSTAFKKSEWSELYAEFSKKTSSMRFTLN